MASTTSTTSSPSCAPAPDAPPPGEPPNFAVYNISLVNGAVDFVDETVKRRRTSCAGFALGIPFLSNLPSQREIKIEPEAGASCSTAAAFDSAALDDPFRGQPQDRRAPTVRGPRSGALSRLHPRRICRCGCRPATLDADLKLDFEQAKTTGLEPQRQCRVRMRPSWPTPAAATLLDFESLSLALADVRPLEGRLHLSDVASDRAAPEARARRRRHAEPAGDGSGDRCYGKDELFPHNRRGRTAKKTRENQACRCRSTSCAWRAGRSAGPIR